ncbi:Tuberous sclerosis 2-like protein [Malassezia vespertilionis]|uniref:UDP-N-acetylglucosamine transferase subunit ALG13 n=1 Tax=Malassezia vespertilionis TaxID=2020962 RepID=A0A2N1JCJ2_9BASI|nr:Tuberous sclerosis 2-like protein [Malassezia vespertilionis]PKI84253.1 Tsc2p [Malassezia vespertilionis]WFD06151.1 Tuberous sclerosis 2-like protein [Malassezia vespertilionis]
MENGIRVLVTVGSTRFDALVDAVTGKKCLDAIGALNANADCTGTPTLFLQYGRSPLSIPAHATPCTYFATDALRYSVCGVEVVAFTYTPTLRAFLEDAYAVVSHAGAGTLLEALRAKNSPRILVVPNPTLMDNHQDELAGALAPTYVAIGHLAALSDDLCSLSQHPFMPFPLPPPDALHKVLQRTLRMDPDSAKSGPSKGPLGVPFFKSFQSRSAPSKGQPPALAKGDVPSGVPTKLDDMYHSTEFLLANKASEAEQLARTQTLVDTLHANTVEGASMLDPLIATPLVSSLMILCVRLLHEEYSLDVRLKACDILAATLQFAEASTASSAAAKDASMSTGGDAVLPTQVLGTLDRALLFRLVVQLRNPDYWDDASLIEHPRPALHILAHQLNALKALTREGRDLLPFRDLIVVLTEWLSRAWGCMFMLRKKVAKLTMSPSDALSQALHANERCAYALLQLLTAVTKFNASRISAKALKEAIFCVTSLLLNPDMPTVQESRAKKPAASPEDALDTAGYTYYGLEQMSPYFNTPKIGATKTSTDMGKRGNANAAIADGPSTDEFIATIHDTDLPELKETEVHLILKMLDTAVCFAFIPTPCIPAVVYTLSRAMGLPALRVDVDSLLVTLQFRRDGIQGDMWNVMSNLLRSHSAISVLRTAYFLLRPKDTLDPGSGYPTPIADDGKVQPSILLGAMLLLHAALIRAAEDRLENGLKVVRTATKLDEGTVAMLSLPAVAAAVQGGLQKELPILDLIIVLMLDDYLPERQVDMNARVDPVLAPRVRQAPIPLCTLFRDNDVEADWDLMLDLHVLAKRHMALWRASLGAKPSASTKVSPMVIHVLVEILSSIPARPEQRDSQDALPLWDKSVASMPHLASLFWPLAPLLPDSVMVDMVQQNRIHHAYVPSSPNWLDNTKELVNTFFPSVPLQAKDGSLTSAPMTRYEVIRLISTMYNTVQDMPQYRSEMIEHIVVPLVERALPTEHSIDTETMLRTMLCHAATVSATDARIGHGRPFSRLRQALVTTIQIAEGADIISDRKLARAQHSRQMSMGPSSKSDVRDMRTRIQRAIRSIGDMITIFYQLSFVMPNATAMLEIDMENAPKMQARARECTLALFRDLLMLLQCNASFDTAIPGMALHDTSETAELRASTLHTTHVPASVRIVILQWVMRLRADRHHRIFFVHDMDEEIMPIAQLFGRVEEMEEDGVHTSKRTLRSDQHEDRSRERGRARSLERDRPEQLNSAAQSREEREISASRGAPQEPESMLWSVPETIQVPLPNDAWPSILWQVYAHQHNENELPEHRPSSDEPLVFPTSEYLGVLISLLQSESNWEIVSYIITHLPIQLSNKHCFCGPNTRQQITAMHNVLCTLILQQKQFPNLVFPEGIKRTDMYAAIYATLQVLISYRLLLSRTQHDELVESFIMGLTKSQNTAQPCIRALVSSCYELQKSFTRLVPGMLMKLSTIMSSMTMSVHILELMNEISSFPTLYANFTEAEYKRLFGIALQYIQYHQSDAANAREDIKASPAKFSLSQYVMMLAYSNIAQWFMSLRVADRPKHIAYITRGLMLASEGRDALPDQTLVCLDFLARVAYSNVESKPTRSLIRFMVTDAERPFMQKSTSSAERTQTWLMGKGLVTICSLKRTGWFELLVRRPSGAMSLVAKLENEPSVTLVDEERAAQMLPLTLQRTREVSTLKHPPRFVPSPLAYAEFYKDRQSELRRMFPGSLAPRKEEPEPDAAQRMGTPSSGSPSVGTGEPSSPARKRESVLHPAYIALQLSAYPDMVVDKAPLLLPSDASTDRLLRAIDLTPVYDFHKIGVLYVGYGQATEAEILSNTHGSSAYMKFLSGLGDLIPLQGQEDVYTGGLDRKSDEHGKYAYAWKDSIKQIVFHTASLMPNRPNDPNCSAKKALIGNDWVHIVFNESNMPYRFGTIPSQFNFVNIVISPHTTLRNGIDAYEVNDDMFFRVHLQRRSGLPDFSAVGEGKLVSFAALPKFVRNLAMLCDRMSQIYLDTGESMVPYTSNWVTRLHHVERFRVQLEKKRAEQAQGVEPDSAEARDFTRMFDIQ